MSWLARVVQELALGGKLESCWEDRLVAELLGDELRAAAFGVTAENGQAVLQRRLELLQVVYPEVQAFCQQQFAESHTWLEMLWQLWLPLGLWLGDRRYRLNRPLIQGILGGQGTGKTTLGALLTLILAKLGYHTLSFSLDDLYKTHAERLHLREQDARLIWRGPPGTHDVALGIRTLDALRHPQPGQPVAVPRFDKSLQSGSGDRTHPELVQNVDIVLFEGWFVGARPVDPVVLQHAPEPILTEGDREFAGDMNRQLQAYLPLWGRLDSLIVLQPVDFRLSKQWRKQAEQQMRATGKAGMSDAEVEAFVDYFWKALHPDLFVSPLLHNPSLTDLVVEVQPDHFPGRVYRP